MAAARIKLGEQSKLYLGNLDAERDWGHAKEFVEGMWLMMQQEKPEDFVLATGVTYKVREFVELAFKVLDIDIIWEGEGIEEKGIDKKSKKILVELNPRYFRPTEVDLLIGDATKAKKILGWEPKICLKDLIKEMVEHDYNSLKK